MPFEAKEKCTDHMIIPFNNDLHTETNRLCSALITQYSYLVDVYSTLFTKLLSKSLSSVEDVDAMVIVKSPPFQYFRELFMNARCTLMYECG